MANFISCDWGTSSFRLRLTDATSLQVLAETRSAQGIATTYAWWKEEAAPDRMAFYTHVLLQQIDLLEKKYGSSLKGLTIVLSGMASASIGMMELPYKTIPYQLYNAPLEIKKIPPAGDCTHTILLVSGACTSNDVMRGEETILAGCLHTETGAEQLYIFPGTHSKQVVVQGGFVKDTRTYMTGELFDLLCNKSILTNSIQAHDGSLNKEAFLKGVKESQASNILSSIFHVRTNQLFNKATKEENYHYLSGLLIGEELKNIPACNYAFVTVVSTGMLAALYSEALCAIGLKEKLLQQNSDEALTRGQAFIFSQYQ